MKKITNQKELEELIETVKFILSHDYLNISFQYPGIGSVLLNSKQVVLSIADVDKLCSLFKGISKEEWIAEDIKSFKENKQFEDDKEAYGNDRHKGKRFFPWFAPNRTPEE